MGELEARCVELEAKLESERVHAAQTLKSANAVLQCKMLELEQAKAALQIVVQQDVNADQSNDGETRALACIAFRDAIIRALVSEQKEDNATMEKRHPSEASRALYRQSFNVCGSHSQLSQRIWALNGACPFWLLGTCGKLN